MPLQHVVISIGAIAVFVFAHEWLTLPLDDNSLASDLNAIRLAYDVDGIVDSKKSFTSADVETYYSETTNREYALLDYLFGSGMHTRLAGTQQAAYVMYQIASIQAHTVLEVGAGKGHCARWLASELPDVHFTALDLSSHVIISDIPNLAFVAGDATKLDSQKYDVIFGVESLCHLDTQLKLLQFVQQATMKLNDDGLLVVIDGFRSAGFQNASLDQQLAMQLAESGFKIRRMPSRLDWISACADSGLVLIEHLPLTSQAIPFWDFGWRISRLLIRSASFVRWLSSVRPHTAANLLSVTTVAHALRDSGAAEYGMLVFMR